MLPRKKEWHNGEQAESLKTFLKTLKIRPVKFHALRACFATQMHSNGVPAPIFMKIGGLDKKGATECLGFVQSEIDLEEMWSTSFQGFRII